MTSSVWCFVESPEASSDSFRAGMEHSICFKSNFSIQNSMKILNVPLSILLHRNNRSPSFQATCIALRHSTWRSWEFVCVRGCGTYANYSFEFTLLWCLMHLERGWNRTFLETGVTVFVHLQSLIRESVRIKNQCTENPNDIVHFYKRRGDQLSMAMIQNLKTQGTSKIQNHHFLTRCRKRRCLVM